MQSACLILQAHALPLSTGHSANLHRRKERLTGSPFPDVKATRWREVSRLRPICPHIGPKVVTRLQPHGCLISGRSANRCNVTRAVKSCYRPFASWARGGALKG
jgi:hypothetical protein